jgi:hypothetical protein
MNAVPDNSIGGRQVYVLPISKQPVTETHGITVGSNGTVADANSFGYAVLSADGATITRYAEKMSISEIWRLIWLTAAWRSAPGLSDKYWFFPGGSVRRAGNTSSGLSRRRLPHVNCPRYVTGTYRFALSVRDSSPSFYLTARAWKIKDNYPLCARP